MSPQHPCGGNATLTLRRTAYTIRLLGPQSFFCCLVSAVPVAFMSISFASFRRVSRLARLGMAVVAAVVVHFSAGAAVAPTLAGAAPMSRSFADLRDSAAKGDPIAQRLVANAYLTGEGVKQDLAEAVKWLRKSAEQNDPTAQYVLGILHDEGRGVPQDLREAVKWYERAAQQGLPDAQFNLALCYAKGEGVLKDSKKAAEWFRKAAQNPLGPDPQAQARLGLAYITGNGVERDSVEAALWLRKAAYPPGEDAKAQFFLGRLYQEGEGVTHSATEAVRWFRAAAQQGYADAQFHLGRMLLAGDGVDRNPTEGRNWMEKAAAQRQEAALQYLAQGASGTTNPATASTAGMSPMTAAATGRPPASAFPTPSVRESPFTAPQTSTGLSFSASGQDTNTNLNPSIGMRDPLPFTPTLPPPGKAAEVFPTMPPGKSAATDTTAKEPGLPPFTAPPATKEPVVTTPTPDIFSTKTGSVTDTNPGGLFPEPGRTREPLPEPRAREHSIPAPASSGSSETSNWVAIASMLISALILFLGIAMLVVFKTRLHGLEAELKKAQFELSKANVNLSAMMHQVEQLALAAPAAAAKTSLPEWNPEPAKAHASSFKMHRSK